MSVQELADNQDVDLVLIVREREVRRKRDGERYLRLVLSDPSGETVPANVWDFASVDALCVVGAALRVTGRYEVHPRFGGRVLVRSVSPAADGPARPAAALEADLRSLVATVQDRDLRRLLECVFSGAVWEQFVVAPAAKRYHQAYRHGLLEHTLSVAQGVSAMAATFGGIDRDVAVTGALLHDIGKLEAYTTLADGSIEMTDAGKLQGEIALGYFRVRAAIESLPGFPEDTAAAVLHIILSHHGQLEWGSPVVPCTREATLVHTIDNLGGRLGSFDRLEKDLPEGAAWSGFDRALGHGAFFGARAGAGAAAASAAAGAAAAA